MCNGKTLKNLGTSVGKRICIKNCNGLILPTTDYYHGNLGWFLPTNGSLDQSHATDTLTSSTGFRLLPWSQDYCQKLALYTFALHRDKKKSKFLGPTHCRLKLR